MNTNYLKLFAIFKSVITKLKYNKRFIVKIPFYIGNKSNININKRGSIHVEGKINVKDYVSILAKGDLCFGDRCTINSFSRIICLKKICLGDRVVIANFVSILDHDHNPEIVNGTLDIENMVTAPIVIGNHVWIGDKVTICKGVKLGNNVVVAANAVVTHSFPSDCIIGGVPARIIKFL